MRAFTLALCSIALSYAHAARADARRDARKHYEAGMRAIGEGRYEVGVAELEEAYATLPHPSVLYNIARAKVLAGDDRGGLAYYRRYLESDPSDRAEVERAMAEVETKLARQEVEKAARETARIEAERQRDAGLAPTPAPPPPAAPKPSEPAPAPADNPFLESVETASKTAQSVLDAPSSVSIITEEEIRLSGIIKIPELLRRLAGVDIMQVTGAQTEVSLRGFNQRLSNKVLVLVDGRSVYVDLLGATFWQTLSIGVEDIRQIEVVRGPGSALYGGVAFGGVINILTKTAADTKGGARLGYGSYDQTHGSVWAAGREGVVSYRVSAGYDYQPRWSRQVDAGRADVRLGSSDQNASSRTVRMDVRSFVDLPRRWRLGVGGGLTTGSMETLGIGPLTTLVLPSFTSTDVTTTLTKDFFESRVYYNRLGLENSLDVANVGQSLLPGRADQNVLGVDGLFRVPFRTGSVQHQANFGAAYRYKNIDWTYQDGRRTENHYSAFVQETARFGKHLSLVGDYRADYVPYLARVVHSPRGSVLVHPNEKSTVRATVATAFRPPTFLESYLRTPVQLPQAGGALVSEGFRSDDPSFRIEPENLLNTELGYLNQMSEYLSLDVAAYYNQARNMIQLANARPVSLGDVGMGLGDLDRETGLFPLFFSGFSNQCQRYDVVGGELGVKVFPLPGVDLHGTYTMNLAGTNDAGCSVAERANLVDDQRTSVHKLNLGVQARSKFGLEGSVDFHAVTAQRWAERLVDADAQRVSNEAFALSGYSLLNLRLGYRFYGDRIELSGTVFNLLDQRHRQHPFGQLLGRRAMAFVGYRF